MDKKNKIEQAIDFCEAVDNQMEANRKSYAKIKEERILKNDRKEQVPLRKVSAKPSKVLKRTVLQKRKSNKKY